MRGAFLRQNVLSIHVNGGERRLGQPAGGASFWLRIEEYWSRCGQNSSYRQMLSEIVKKDAIKVVLQHASMNPALLTFRAS